MNEPTLDELGQAARNGPSVTRAVPPAPHVVLPHARFRFWPLVVLALAVLGGWYWFSNRSITIPVITLTDQAVPLDLQGLDQPTKLDGSCVASFLVHGAGSDEAGRQHFALSVQIVSDPADEAALARLMATDDCSAELKLVGETLTQRLGTAAVQHELITTSYATKSGTRLFLP